MSFVKKRFLLKRRLVDVIPARTVSMIFTAAGNAITMIPTPTMIEKRFLPNVSLRRKGQISAIITCHEALRKSRKGI